LPLIFLKCQAVAVLSATAVAGRYGIRGGPGFLPALAGLAVGDLHKGGELVIAANRAAVCLVRSTMCSGKFRTFAGNCFLVFRPPFGGAGSGFACLPELSQRGCWIRLRMGS
jgi:hypothetical protein